MHADARRNTEYGHLLYGGRSVSSLRVFPQMKQREQVRPRRGGFPATCFPHSPSLSLVPSLVLQVIFVSHCRAVTCVWHVKDPQSSFGEWQHTGVLEGNRDTLYQHCKLTNPFQLSSWEGARWHTRGTLTHCSPPLGLWCNRVPSTSQICCVSSSAYATQIRNTEQN